MKPDKRGFKQQLEDAERNIPNKSNYLKVYKEHQKKLLERSAEKPENPILLKYYKRGYKDLTILVDLGFSVTYLEQHVFCMGLNRKTKDSDPKLKAYCDGICDRLLEEK